MTTNSFSVTVLNSLVRRRRRPRLLPHRNGIQAERILQQVLQQPQPQQQYFRTSSALYSATFDDDDNDNNNNNTPNEHIRRQQQQQHAEKRRLLQNNSKLQLAPMMDYTDRHFRHLTRLVSSRTLLYTEMIAANSLAYERRRHMEAYRLQQQQQQHPCNYYASTQQEVRSNYDVEYLRRSLGQAGQGLLPLEGPSVLQLGGSNVDIMKEAAQCVMDLTDRHRSSSNTNTTNNNGSSGSICDYTALNLNCGCPSPKVAGKGCFGAALMDDPHLVADLTSALHEGCDGRLPITVKCRIGTDTDRPFTKLGYEAVNEEEEYSKLCRFIETVASHGIVTDFSVHARIAVLTKSFSPADNRKIPPLKYDMVHRLVQDYSPALTFSINGGVDTLSQVQEQFAHCPNLAGVMIGRAWAADPWSFAMADHVLYGEEEVGQASTKTKTRLDILQDYGKHADYEERMGDPAKIRRFLTKAVTTLFTGEHNSKKYRIALDEIAGIPKRLQQEQGGTTLSMEGQPPLSELIMNAAHTHLSEEVLYRTAQESYERQLWMQEDDMRKKKDRIVVAASSAGRSTAVTEWQTDRQQQQQNSSSTTGTYEAALAGDESSPFAATGS